MYDLFLTVLNVWFVSRFTLTLRNMGLVLLNLFKCCICLNGWIFDCGDPSEMSIHHTTGLSSVLLGYTDWGVPTVRSRPALMVWSSHSPLALSWPGSTQSLGQCHAEKAWVGTDWPPLRCLEGHSEASWAFSREQTKWRLEWNRKKGLSGRKHLAITMCVGWY